MTIIITLLLLLLILNNVLSFNNHKRIIIHKRQLLSMLQNDNDNDKNRVPLITLADDNDKPLISIEDKVIEKSKPYISTSSKSSSSSSSSKSSSSERTSATFGSLSVEDLKSRMIQRDAPQLQLPNRQEDLNGINPITPISFSTVAILMSYVAWQISSYLSAHFAIEYVNSDIYPVQRLAIVSRNIVVGLSTLASGFSGVIAIGLILLGITVGVGVAKGELNPNPKDDNLSQD